MQVTRLAASELEAGLGQKIVIVNQPGGAGSIGTKAAMDAPKDGYTWTAGAAKQLGTYPVLGMINSKVDDFHLYLQYENIEQTEKAVGLARDISYNINTDVGVSLNYFISAQVLLKAEYHQVEAEGPALFPVFGPNGVRLDANILGADDGSYWIVALSTSF